MVMPIGASDRVASASGILGAEIRAWPGMTLTIPDRSKAPTRILQGAKEACRKARLP